MLFVEVTCSTIEACNTALLLMLLSHSGEYPCECKHSIFAANSPNMIRLARRMTETSEALQDGYECLRISYEFLTKLTIT